MCWFVWLFSGREEMHLQILKAFVGLHEFSDLNLVQALRFVSPKYSRMRVWNIAAVFTFSPVFFFCVSDDVEKPPPPSFLLDIVCVFFLHLRRLAGSFCGASVSREKLRRLTGWWRRSQLATATVTPGSSNPPVRAQRGFVSPESLSLAVQLKKVSLIFKD